MHSSEGTLIPKEWSPTKTWTFSLCSFHKWHVWAMCFRSATLTPHQVTGRANQDFWLALICKWTDPLRLYLELSTPLELLYLLQRLLDDNWGPSILPPQLARRVVIYSERECIVKPQLSRPLILLICLGTASAHERQGLGPLPYPSLNGLAMDGKTILNTAQNG